MMEISTERTRDSAVKVRFFLTGFTQAAGIRIYAFEGRDQAGRIGYTVEVDLALILGYGIRIQELPLLCRELLQQGAQPEGEKAFVFTEQRMRNHAEKLSAARQDAERRKKPPRHLESPAPEMSYRPPFR